MIARIPQVLTLLDFTKDGLGYVQSRLSRGNTLSRSLLKLPLESGRLMAIVPENTDPDMPLTFEFGGIASRRDTENHLSNWISTFLDRGGNLFLEDGLARPTDK